MTDYYAIASRKNKPPKGTSDAWFWPEYLEEEGPSSNSPELKEDWPGPRPVGSPSPPYRKGRKVSARSPVYAKSELASVAQKVYDSWEVDEEGLDPEIGGGGICDRVCDAMSDVLIDKGFDIYSGGHSGDDHAWAIAVDHKNRKAYGVDISPSKYETGGGYSWVKIPGVEFRPEDVEVWDMDYNDLATFGVFDEISSSELSEQAPTGLTRHQRNIFTKFSWGKADEGRIARALFEMRVNAYDNELNRLLAQVGAGHMRGALTNAGIRGTMAAESRQDARSIVQTYNRELGNRIKKVKQRYGSPTRRQYATELNAWEQERADWKGRQVAEWTVNRTINEAADEFFTRNSQHLKGRKMAVLTGPNPAAEPICQGWLNRGRVPLQEALDNPPPYHLNCPHLWRFDVSRMPWIVALQLGDRLWKGE